MDSPNLIEIRLEGKNVFPGKVKSREIGEMIDAIEEMIVSVVVKKNPKISKQSIVVGISDIKPGSFCLRFDTNIEHETLSAFKDISRSISDDYFDDLPFQSIKALKRIIKFTKNHEGNAAFFTKDSQSNPLAIITPKTEVREHFLIQGETALYGTIVRVGGEEKPTIQFRTIDNQLVYCHTDKMLALKAAKNLYEKVGLYGVAHWNIKNGEIRKFYADRFLDYKSTSISEGFKKLSDNFGNCFSQIDDVKEFVNQLRNDSIEENI